MAYELTPLLVGGTTSIFRGIARLEEIGTFWANDPIAEIYHSAMLALTDAGRTIRRLMIIPNSATDVRSRLGILRAIAEAIYHQELGCEVSLVHERDISNDALLNTDHFAVQDEDYLIRCFDGDNLAVFSTITPTIKDAAACHDEIFFGENSYDPITYAMKYFPELDPQTIAQLQAEARKYAGKIQAENKCAYIGLHDFA